ncbi:hypothetical protein COT96_02285 [Candidatus Falkowbacteria bacterium CG10_big_fil_rev_8_21_14_0_10_38_22]|uniref:Uncharacterized protein n=2 Tax=Candidatus Falkowiibacteriota TaxID=1752728 RepID=A0A2M6WQB6_9BACT|nr:MAG: hypothetical protein COT96_02285 [Candidatus Falkowbacteria bacterium CG10_big_fil_rev_8_21_14_0_10_38_22]
MKTYKTKSIILAGTSYKEISKKAFILYNGIRRKTKRRPYVRSAYFKKDKIFLGLFWTHIYNKNYWDQMRRMKFFGCALELIKNSRFEPTSKENPNKPTEILHRFAGVTKNNDLFFVQIKEDKRTSEKWLVSVFPIERLK